MRIHPREKKVQKAERALIETLMEVMRMDLTNAEYLQVLNSVFSDAIALNLKHQIRQERHGDKDKPGGLE